MSHLVKWFISILLEQKKVSKKVKVEIKTYSRSIIKLITHSGMRMRTTMFQHFITTQIHKANDKKLLPNPC